MLVPAVSSEGSGLDFSGEVVCSEGGLFGGGGVVKWHSRPFFSPPFLAPLLFVYKK
jgi:hypothetical protein